MILPYLALVNLTDLVCYFYLCIIIDVFVIKSNMCICKHVERICAPFKGSLCESSTICVAFVYLYSLYSQIISSPSSPSGRRVVMYTKSGGCRPNEMGGNCVEYRSKHCVRRLRQALEYYEYT